MVKEYIPSEEGEKHGGGMTSIGNYLSKERMPQQVIPPENNNEQKPTKFYDETVYSTVYHGLTTHFRLERPIETLILAFILSFSKKGGSCWCSQETMAVYLGVSSMTIGSGLQELAKKELIEYGGKHPTYHTIK